MDMKNVMNTRTYLMICAMIAIGIGAALLFAPAAFQASTGITLGDNINLLSETRAPGGLLLGAGLVMAWGAFSSHMAYTALVLSSLIYGAYGVSRVLSMVLDGIPHANLVAATGLEIVLAIVGLAILGKRRSASS